MKKKILLSLILGLVGCNNKSDINSQTASSETVEEKRQRTSREFLKKYLPYPDSLKFRNQIGLCGEVNYMKKLGTYTGFKRFVMVDQNIIFIETYTDPDEFEFAWKSSCKRK